MRFDRGWVKIWRIENTHWLYKDNFARLLWWDLIVMANYKHSRILSGKEIQELPPGTVVTSLAEMAERVGMSTKGIRARLDAFQNDHMIVTQKSRQGTIITICNWDKYQSKEDIEGHEEVTQKSHRGHTEVTQRSHRGHVSKECKKERIEEDISPAKVLAKTKKPKEKSKGSLLFNEYREVYLTKYDHCPPAGPAEYTQLNRLITKVGFEMAKDLLGFYIVDYKSDYCQRAKHPIGLFTHNFNDIFLKFKEMYPNADYERKKDGTVA